MAYLTPVDVANRALQHLGATRIDAAIGFAENSLNASETAFAYDILRKAELRTGVWRFAIRKAILRPIDSNTMLLVPTMWASTTTYFVGSIVSDQTGQLWSSRRRNNLGNDPTQTLLWEQYFGPLTVMKYDSSTTYFDGELVYTAPGDGSYNVYRSLQNSNAVDPSLPNQWSATTTYFQNQVVQVFPAWAGGTSYSQGQTVLYTDGNVYSSLTGRNLGNIPVAGSAFWARQTGAQDHQRAGAVTWPDDPPAANEPGDRMVGVDHLFDRRFRPVQCHGIRLDPELQRGQLSECWSWFLGAIERRHALHVADRSQHQQSPRDLAKPMDDNLHPRRWQLDVDADRRRRFPDGRRTGALEHHLSALDRSGVAIQHPECLSPAVRILARGTARSKSRLGLLPRRADQPAIHRLESGGRITSSPAMSIRSCSALSPT